MANSGQPYAAGDSRLFIATPQASGVPYPPVAPANMLPGAPSDAVAMKNCERAQMVALVGTDVVLVSDVLAVMEKRLEVVTEQSQSQFLSQQRQLRNKRKGLPPKAESEVMSKLSDGEVDSAMVQASGEVEVARTQGEDTLAELREMRRVQLTQEIMTAVAAAAAAKGDRSKVSAEDVLRLGMLENLLKDVIEARLVFYDARQSLPAEGLTSAEKQINKLFDSTEIKRLMKKAKVDSWPGLDEWLRGRGSSVDRERRLFFERTIAQQWMQQQVKVDEEITYEQMTTYYRERGAEFDRPARTRWQLISIRFTTYPSKSEAYQAIAEIGNKVLAGQDFSEFAESVQNSKTEEPETIREWTPPTPGRAAPSAFKSGVPAVVENAVIGLPAGQLSPILDDWRGYYIVKVIERLPAGRVPFEIAQDEIRTKVKRQRFAQQVERYMKKIRDRVPVWTILDDPRVAAAAPNSIHGLYGPLSTGGVQRR